MIILQEGNYSSLKKCGLNVKINVLTTVKSYTLNILATNMKRFRLCTITITALNFVETRSPFETGVGKSKHIAQCFKNIILETRDKKI